MKSDKLKTWNIVRRKPKSSDKPVHETTHMSNNRLFRQVKETLQTNEIRSIPKSENCSEETKQFR